MVVLSEWFSLSYLDADFAAAHGMTIDKTKSVKSESTGKKLYFYVLVQQRFTMTNCILGGTMVSPSHWHQQPVVINLPSPAAEGG